jgi:hypothetical protein
MVKHQYDHADLKAQYDQDALETDTPWDRWEVYISAHAGWAQCINPVTFDPDTQYRRSDTVGMMRVFNSDHGWFWIDASIYDAVPEHLKGRRMT